MSITMDKESWERGVRDAFRTGIAGPCPSDADPYSYWSGFYEGKAARHREEVTVDAAQICASISEEICKKRIVEGAGDPMDCQPPDPKHLAARGIRKKRGAK